MLLGSSLSIWSHMLFWDSIGCPRTDSILPQWWRSELDRCYSKPVLGELPYLTIFTGAAPRGRGVAK